MPRLSILTELDALLDTRLGTLRELYPDSIDHLIDNGYLVRLHDTFSLLDARINDVAYIERYNRRDVDILKKSYSTYIVSLLRDIIIGNSKLVSHSPMALDVSVTINIYPYSLSAKELEAITELLIVKTGIDVIDVIDAPPSSLTPQYLKDRYDHLFIYSYKDWMETNRLILNDNKIPNVYINTPWIALPGKEDDIKLGDLIGAQENIITCMRFYHGLNFLTLSDMSIYLPLENTDDANINTTTNI